jgi:hypothetical protein
MQQALVPTDRLTVTPPPPNYTTSNRLLEFNELQQLGERLRLTYGPIETSLPARLAELVERLARREQRRD